MKRELWTQFSQGYGGYWLQIKNMHCITISIVQHEKILSENLLSLAVKERPPIPSLFMLQTGYPILELSFNDN